MCYAIKKGPFRIRGKLFPKSAKPFLKKNRSLNEKGRLEFVISFLELEGNSDQSSNVKIFVSQIVYILRPFEEKYAVAPMEKGRIEFSITSLNRGKILSQMGMLIFSP